MLKEIQIKLFTRNLAPQFPNCVCVCMCCMYVGEREDMRVPFSPHSYFSFLFIWCKHFSNTVKCTNQVLLKAAVDKCFRFWKMEKWTALFKLYDNKVLIISGLCTMERLQTLSCVCSACEKMKIKSI